MKRIVSLILLAIVCLGVCSCGVDSEAPDGMQLASNDSAAYLLYVPKTWTLGAASEYASAIYSADDPSNVSVFFFAPETDEGISEYWEKFAEEYKATFPTMTLISSENTLIDEKAATKYIFTATVSGEEYKFMQYITKYGGMVYMLTYTAPIENFDLHTEEVQYIADNFRFR